MEPNGCACECCKYTNGSSTNKWSPIFANAERFSRYLRNVNATCGVCSAVAAVAVHSSAVRGMCASLACCVLVTNVAGSTVLLMPAPPMLVPQKQNQPPWLPLLSNHEAPQRMQADVSANTAATTTRLREWWLGITSAPRQMLSKHTFANSEQPAFTHEVRSPMRQPDLHGRPNSLALVKRQKLLLPSSSRWIRLPSSVGPVREAAC